MLTAVFILFTASFTRNYAKFPSNEKSVDDSIHGTSGNYDDACNPIQRYKLYISNQVISNKLDLFWRSTGFCPPDPHQEAHKFMLSTDMKLNLFHIGSLPHKGLSQVRIHWMLDLVQIRVLPSLQVVCSFSYLDELVLTLWKNDLQPGFELMGNPSNFFTNFENKTQVYIWKNLVQSVAKHYIDIYGAEWVRKWNFETWNEPDHHDFDGLNFTIQGFLNYYDACSEGLYNADKSLKFGGPGGSCRLQSGHSPICLALLDHCANGKNYFTGDRKIRLDFISFHKKGNGSSLSILKEEAETIQYIKANFPKLADLPYYNDEADPMKNWALPERWRADSTYAAMVVKIIFSHIFAYYVNGGSSSHEALHFNLLSSDNAFLSYFPNQFSERTLLARFQINNTIPNHVDFVRKPIYSVFGILSKVCSKILYTQVLTNDNVVSPWTGQFGVLATQCTTSKELVVIMYNSADTSSNGTIADVNIILNISSNYVTGRLAVFEVNNNVSNPYGAWVRLGSPAYPSQKDFSLIKDKEEPNIKGPWKFEVSQPLKIKLKVLNPGVTLLNICLEPQKINWVTNIQFLKVWNETLQISWKDDHNRCLLTYIVKYSSHLKGPYLQINEKKVSFRSYWHTCTNFGKSCHINGFYQVSAIDYWGREGPSSKPAFYDDLE